MKEIKDDRTVKYIYYYLRVMIYFLPISFLFQFLMTIYDFVKNGEITCRMSMFGIKIIDMQRKMTFNKGVDSMFEITFALGIIFSFFFALLNVLKFIKNITNDSLLVEDNGIFLLRIGKNLVSLMLITTFAEIFRNLTSFGQQLFAEKLVMISMLSFVAVIHPFFIFALFFFVLGKILIRASFVKQENDLTV